MNNMLPDPTPSSRIVSKRRLGPVLVSPRIFGAGEMADLTRAYDWSSSPLGPIEAWPDTLITTVNMLLGSRHPMFLWWGPDLIQFYNDGYRASIRADKHPKAVGQRALECWSEIWHIIGPQIQAVMGRGESSWHINQLVPIFRDAKLEEVFWTYSYSPVRDRDGNVQGVLVVCSETTEQVLAERRLRLLHDMAVKPTTPRTSASEGSKNNSLLSMMQTLVRRLDDPADIPFAALFLVEPNEILQAGHTKDAGNLAAPDGWPLRDVASSRTPRLLERLPENATNRLFAPWQRPVAQAYALPLTLPASSIKMVMIFGLSSHLPFDSHYETFLQLVGTRLVALLDAKIHQTEKTRAVEKYRFLIEANPFGTMITDLQGRVKYVSPKFLHTLGYCEADVESGKVSWANLTPAEYREADACAVEQLKAVGRCDVYETVFLACDGRRVPILIGKSTMGSSGGETEVAAFMTDLTPLKAAEAALRRANDELERTVAERTAALNSEVSDRRRAEDNLRMLTGRLLRSQDEERRYMARELHDHAGQTLVALILNLSELQESAGTGSPEVKQLVADSYKLSEDLSREIRTLSYLLHPPLLDEAGLGSALRWFVNGFSERSKIKVDLDIPDDMGRLPTELELVVFRVIQESLTNVHRHSGSASAQIRLERWDGQVTLEIRDQGKGISRKRQRELSGAHVGVGVRGMEERVRQFNGTLKVDSDRSGTTVMVELPLGKRGRA